MILLDGKETAARIKTEIAREVAAMIDRGEKPPHLAALLVGEDPASLTYVSSKEKASREVGMTSSVYRYPESMTEKQLLEAVDFLNRDEEVDGYIVQLPLPGHINEQNVIRHIRPDKDIDGFHPENTGNMVLGFPSFLPATPYGILLLLEQYRIETAGKHCVVVGRSHIVGTPVSILLSRKAYPGNCTVTLCHTQTREMERYTREADILIIAMGQPNFIKAEMVRQDAVVIDVGMHRIPDDSKKSGFRLTGDVDFSGVSKKCSYISPVPGGVGLMTIVALLKNTLKAAKR